MCKHQAGNAPQFSLLALCIENMLYKNMKLRRKMGIALQLWGCSWELLGANPNGATVSALQAMGRKLQRSYYNFPLFSQAIVEHVH